MTMVMASLGVSACSDETGIVIEVTNSAGFTAPVSSLRFFVGESIIRADGYFADRQQSDNDDADVAGRDLVDDPFRLIVRPPSGAGPDDRVAVGVLALDERGQAVGFGYLPSPIGFVSGTVTLWQVELLGLDHPDYVDTFPGCFAWTDGDTSTIIGTRKDFDCDGFERGDGGDCDDRNPGQFPGNTEICGNQLDDDCDPSTNEDDLQDRAEICNGIDDNCDGNCDEGLDEDGDGYTTCGSLVAEAGGECLGFDSSLMDCVDDDEDIYPGAVEVLDGIDNNCSGFCDDDPALDPDGDGFTTFGRFGICSLEGDLAGDCDEDKNVFHPGAHDFCDGLDGDCRAGEEDLTTCFVNVNVGMENKCVQGRRSCAGGSGELGTCVSLEGLAVVAPGLSPEVCGNYEACEANDMDAYIDPYECTLAGAGLVAGTIETCYTTTTSAGGLCPAGNTGGETIMVFPPPPAPAQLVSPCTIQIIGPPVQQGFHVSLGPAPVGDVTVVSEPCDSKLAIKPSAFSSEASIIITRSDSAGNFQVVQVNLINTVVDECGTLPPLSCSSWNTL